MTPRYKARAAKLDALNVAPVETAEPDSFIDEPVDVVEPNEPPGPPNLSASALCREASFLAVSR